MHFFTNLKLAISGLSANKLRTLLTVTGIVIGISAVIIILAAGQGLRGMLVGQLEMFGSNVIQTEIRVPGDDIMGMDTVSSMVAGAMVTTMKVEDAEAVRKLPNVKSNYAAIWGQDFVTYQNKDKKASLIGVSATYVDIDAMEVAEGRFFTEEEDRALAKVCVLGQNVKSKLFGAEDALGKFVKIGQTKLKVIGVAEKIGMMMYLNMDDQVYIPVRTMQKHILGIDYVMYFLTQAEDSARIQETAEDIRILMRKRHNITDPGKDDFAVASMDEAIDIYDTVLGAISILLIAIASISLIVGGVGIMNVMYVIVIERTKEIGLRKAMGATYKNIMYQFLWEAIIITFLGGVFGVLVGVGMSYLVAIVAKSQGLDWDFYVSPSSLILACTFSVSIGLIFGIYPARKAAQLHPIEAMRYE